MEANKMTPFEEYLVKLLQGHITLNGEVVEVRRQFNPQGHLPCITLDLGIEDTTDYYYHSFHEKERVYFRRSSEIQINTWCNNEEDRESINTQIMNCFYDAIEHDYTYCSNYSNGRCKTVNGACPCVSPTGSRDIKRKCPQPERYEYESLQTKYGLLVGTTMISPPRYLDEEGEHPPILRSVFTATTDYIEMVREVGDKNRGFEGVDVHVE